MTTREKRKPARPGVRRVLPGLMFVLLSGLAAIAVPAAEPLRVDTITVDVVDERMTALELNDAIPAELREVMSKNYLRAREALARADTAAANTAAFTAAADGADQRVRELDKAIARLARDNDATAISRKLAARQTGAAQALVDAQIEFEIRRTAVAELEQRALSMRSAPVRIRDDITAVEREIAALDAALANDDPASASTPAYAATRILQLAQLKAAQAQLASLRTELSTLEPRSRVLEKEVALAEAEQALAATTLEAAHALVDEANRKQAASGRRDLAEIRAALKNATAPFADEMRYNADLAAELVAMIERTQTNGERLVAAEKQLDEIEDRFASTRDRTEIAGTNPALALLLREERQRLPNYRVFERRLRARAEEINTISFRQIEIADELRTDAAEILAQLRSDLLARGAEDTPETTLKAQEIADTRRALLTKLTAAYSEYLVLLSKFDFSQDRMVDVLKSYQAFLDERLLWLPSAGTLNAATAERALSAAVWLVDAKNWREIVDALVVDVVAHLVPYCLLIIALGAYGSLRGRLQKIVDELGVRVRRPRTDRFRHTLKAVSIEAMRAAVLPAVLLGLGWRLEVHVAGTDFVVAVGTALTMTAPFVFVIYVLCRLTRRGGIAAMHFNWGEHPRALLHHYLRIALTIIPASYFIYVVFDHQPATDHLESLGRMLLILVTAATALLVKIVFNPRDGVPANYLSNHAEGVGDSFRYVWYWLLVALPAALAIAAIAGYQYAANILFVRYLASFGVAFGARIVFDLAVRWVAVVRRRLRLKIALENQAATKAAGEKDATAGPEIDLMEVDANSRQLVRVFVAVLSLVGFWLLWRDVLPALDALGDIELWHYTGATTAGAAMLAVSLQDVLVAIGLTLLFALGARDIPTVLQIGILQRLSLDPGSRYAIRTLLQYLIIGIGVGVVCSRLGFAWSQVQWLVAALGVGLGFGLQEIFANFVSGIIILFERPIRVGDLVTVDDVTGTVERIRIRATTLTDFDRKEVIVPNKTFLTSRVVNWTLTDAVTRVVIPIGISYGDDTSAAREIILGIAERHEKVLETPAPQIFFRELGDSSLNFELRIYVNELGDRLPVTDDILTEVERALPRAGITIPFPQRDLHIAWPGSVPGGDGDGDGKGNAG